MKIIDMLADPGAWERYLRYKQDAGHLTGKEEAALREFIGARGYLRAAEEARGDGDFPLAEKKLIKKSGTDRKRTVYTYPDPENRVLKLLTFLLLRRYDGFFSDSLYSFRVSRGVGKAMNDVLGIPDLGSKYVYKTDIHDYFNSIDVEKLLHMLRPLLEGEEEVFGLFSRLLREKRVTDRGEITEEEKGAMAGVPFAVFLANVYLSDMDAFFEGAGVAYARYSDDILLITDTAEERKRLREGLLTFLSLKGLTVNPEKEAFADPGEAWSFLGVSYCGGTVDVSPVSAGKLKARIRRKARALRRWMARRGATPEQAVKGFLRAMNRKFFEADSSRELTWTRWYFPLITTPRTLKEIDGCMQEWARYVDSGRHGGGRRMKYEKLKELGYVSLVNEWYRYRKPGEAYVSPLERGRARTDAPPPERPDDGK